MKHQVKTFMRLAQELRERLSNPENLRILDEMTAAVKALAGPPEGPPDTAPEH